MATYDSQGLYLIKLESPCPKNIQRPEVHEKKSKFSLVCPLNAQPIDLNKSESLEMLPTKFG